ncbi:hypothetical protein L0P51_19895, partial [Acetatifactor sp. DFI.5.50]|nr:hypothetical protein [Acetatifactor sp. DFI.5.50]
FKFFASKDFNPRSHEGSDLSTFLMPSILMIFQSTLPRGERQVHTHATLVIKIISIHAPTRGATHANFHHWYNHHISIHAPTRGATAIFAKKFSFLSAKIV